jgi:hypothetical protein
MKNYRVVLWFLAEEWGPNVVCDVHAEDIDNAVQKVLRWHQLAEVDGATVYEEDGTCYERGHVGQVQECRALVPSLPE